MTEDNVKIYFKTPLGTVDEHTVDQWELAASKRALQNLRTLLYGDKMENLIKEQMEESDRRIRQYLRDSNGEFKEVYVELEVEGITASDYFKWQSDAMGIAMRGSEEEKRQAVEDIVFPAHPEHYMLAELGVVETLGGLPTNASLAKVEMPQFIVDVVDDSFVHDGYSAVKLQDGTIWAYGLTEYRDTEKGAEMRLRVFWPAACPQQYFDDHTKHFAIEYRNFIHKAIEDIRK